MPHAWLQPGSSDDGIVLVHGAGSDAQAPLLVKLAEAFVSAGLSVLRSDLPFRRERPQGPPPPTSGAADRDGIREALAEMRSVAGSRIYLGGHSYGGRQATMLLADRPELADGLLLLSYPLHPPRRFTELRTAHFPALRTPAMFAHGTRDPFGSPEEMRKALDLIPARTELRLWERAGHDLGGERHAAEIAAGFLSFMEPVEIPVTDVFDLHSVPSRDAEAVLEEYLQEAHRLGLKALRVIHGRGIGVRREMVRTVLQRTPFVASFADAPAEAGGWGATVVTLR